MKTKRSTSPSHGCFLYLYALNSALMLARVALLHLRTLLKQSGELQELTGFPTQSCMNQMITRLFILFLERTLCFPVIKHLLRWSKREPEDQMENLKMVITIKGFLYSFHVYIANWLNNPLNKFFSTLFSSWKNDACQKLVGHLFHSTLWFVGDLLIIIIIEPLCLGQTIRGIRSCCYIQSVYFQVSESYID